MGNLIEDTDAAVWRAYAPKVLHHSWMMFSGGKRMYLLPDAGHGDIQFLSQMLQVTELLLLLTPQDVAMADVKRAVKMFEMTRVPVAGIVENMVFRCSDNAKDYPIFEQDAQRLLKEMGFLFGLLSSIWSWPCSGPGQPIPHPSPEANKHNFRKLAEKLAHQFEQKATRTRPTAFRSSRRHDLQLAPKAAPQSGGLNVLLPLTDHYRLFQPTTPQQSNRTPRTRNRGCGSWSRFFLKPSSLGALYLPVPSRVKS